MRFIGGCYDGSIAIVLSGTSTGSKGVHRPGLALTRQIIHRRGAEYAEVRREDMHFLCEDSASSASLRRGHWVSCFFATAERRAQPNSATLAQMQGGSEMDSNDPRAYLRRIASVTPSGHCPPAGEPIALAARLPPR